MSVATAIALMSPILAPFDRQPGPYSVVVSWSCGMMISIVIRERGECWEKEEVW